MSGHALPLARRYIVSVFPARESSCTGVQVAEGAAPKELEQRPLMRALLQPTAAYVLVAGALEASVSEARRFWQTLRANPGMPS